MPVGIDVIAVAGLLTLAQGAPACALPKAPAIAVTPITKDVVYDFTKTAAELGAMFNTDMAGPVPQGADSSTGGLRLDEPQISTQIAWGYQEFPGGVVCLWYDKVDVKIELAPTIFIAKERDVPGCKEAILAHERRHVEVDRIVFNKYAVKIGKAVQEAVDVAGAMGPYKGKAAVEAAKEKIMPYISATVEAQTGLLWQEMEKEQAKVDTLEEYTRISEICDKADKRHLKGRRLLRN